MRRASLSTLCSLMLVAAGEAGSPAPPAQAAVQRDERPADCARHKFLASEARPFLYQNLGPTAQFERWELYPCGETVRRDVTLPGGVVAKPCQDAPKFRCFESALAQGARSDVFFAVPKTYAGGNSSWSVEGVVFEARAVTGGGSSETAVITAMSGPDSRFPRKQTFIFSVRDGLIAAIIGDGLAPETRTFVVAGPLGIFARTEVP